MNIVNLIQVITGAIENIRSFLAPIPAILLQCTCSRRPGFSAILTSAKIYADMKQTENDDIVRKFVFNVIDKIKKNMQDDGVCFVIIPPGEMKFTLVGANAGGPVILNENPTSTPDNPKPSTNNSYIFAYAIIK